MGAGFYSGFQLAHEVLAPTRLRVSCNLRWDGFETGGHLVAAWQVQYVLGEV